MVLPTRKVLSGLGGSFGFMDHPGVDRVTGLSCPYFRERSTGVWDPCRSEVERHPPRLLTPPKGGTSAEGDPGGHQVSRDQGSRVHPVSRRVVLVVLLVVLPFLGLSGGPVT